MRQYKVGDRVQIVDCAHPIWFPQDEPPVWLKDKLIKERPELIGEIGTINFISIEEDYIGKGMVIDFDNHGLQAYFYNCQLKLVEKAEYRVIRNFCTHIGYDVIYSNEAIDTVINNFLNEQDGDREQTMP